MSLPTWPDGLTYEPLTDGFSIQQPHLTPYETEFEGGARRRRPVSSLRRAIFAMSWQFDNAGYGAFRDFYHRVLNDGSGRFTMLLPDGPGGSYVARTCMFKGMYQASQPQPPFWRISAELHVTGSL